MAIVENNEVGEERKPERSALNDGIHLVGLPLPIRQIRLIRLIRPNRHHHGMCRDNQSDLN